MLDPASIAGLIFTATTVGSMVVLHLRKVQVPRVAIWTDPPPVIYHPAIGKGAIDDLMEAMAYWEKLGYPFEGLWPSTTAPVFGIYVDIMDRDHPLTEEQSGIAQMTGLNAKPNLILEQCRIVIDPGLNAEDRLTATRHELGHALGFEHAFAGLDRKGNVRSYPTGHVMHPKLDKCGKGHRGL